MRQRLRQADEVLGSDVDQTPARAVDVGDEHERDGDGERHDQKHEFAFPVHTIAKEKV